MTNNIRRNEKIYLQQVGDNKYSVIDKLGNTLLACNDNYSIYFKNVNFKNNGIIEARYLGVATSTLVDSHCLDAMYTDEGWMCNGKKLSTARMVAVTNGIETKVVVKDN
jgi:hypothetical protein